MHYVMIYQEMKFDKKKKRIWNMKDNDNRILPGERKKLND